MLFLTMLFTVVLGLLAYTFTSDRGKNTVHARRTQNAGTIDVKAVKHVSVPPNSKAA